MAGKRKVEVFSAGCPVCREAVDLVRRNACSACDVQVRDMHDPDAAGRAQALGIRAVPAVVIDGKGLISLSEGRLVNRGNATGQPSFGMSASFTNQVLAQIELWNNPESYEKKVYVLPKRLDEKVAMLHLAKVGATLTRLDKAQADYIGVPPEGPFKPDHYRY